MDLKPTVEKVTGTLGAEILNIDCLLYTSDAADE